MPLSGQFIQKGKEGMRSKREWQKDQKTNYSQQKKATKFHLSLSCPSSPKVATTLVFPLSFLFALFHAPLHRDVQTKLQSCTKPSMSTHHTPVYLCQRIEFNCLTESLLPQNFCWYSGLIKHQLGTPGARQSKYVKAKKLSNTVRKCQKASKKSGKLSKGHCPVWIPGTLSGKSHIVPKTIFGSFTNGY